MDRSFGAILLLLSATNTMAETRSFRGPRIARSCPKLLPVNLPGVIDQLTRQAAIQSFDELKVQTRNCKDEKLVSDQVKAALATGLNCLSDKSKSTQAEARILKDLVTSPKAQITLQCETDESKRLPSDASGLAFDEGDAGFPGMYIRDRALGRDPARVQATLFHEMIHWTGFIHRFSFDTAYLASACCFEPQTPAGIIACGMLAQEPRPSISSADYLSRFAEVMVGIGLPQIALDSFALELKGCAGSRNPDCTTAVVAGIRQLKTENDFSGRVFEKIAEGLSTRTPRKKSSPPTPEDDLVSALTSCGLSLLQGADYPTFKARLKTLQEAIPKYFSDAAPGPGQYPNTAIELSEAANALQFYSIYIRGDKDAGGDARKDWEALQDLIDEQSARK
jgi:hypothetical protein